MLAWHVAFTAPNQEIRASIEITQLGFPVFFPLKPQVRRCFNRPAEQINGPLFPRYIFSQFDRDRDDWGKIVECRGVCNILKNGNKPVIVHSEIIEAIRSYREPEISTDTVKTFQLEQKVRINTGVLQGIEGIFKGSDRQRTRAFLDILGKRYDIPLDTIIAA